MIKLKPKTSLNDFLFDLFVKPMDNRQLVKINNKWESNNGKKNFLEVIDILLSNKIVSTNNCNQVKNKLAIIYNKAEEIKYGTPVYSAKFIDKNTTKIPHTIFPEATQDTKYVGMQTDFNKAFKFNHYGRAVIINNYSGQYKPSTLLNTDLSELKQISAARKVTIEKICIGAIKNGYDSDLTSNKYKNYIDSYAEILNEIDVILNELNLKFLNNYMIAQAMFSSMDGFSITAILDDIKINI